MIRELTKDELWVRASAYCARGEHCRQEVREKLRQWGCKDENIRDEILCGLEKDGYIDEQRYCRAYVHDKVAYQGWGRVKIKMMLIAKGLSEEYVNSALETIDESEYISALKRALSKYDGMREKQIRLALQRGFEYSEISRLL